MVCNAAGSFASRLARGLAFATAAVLFALVEIACFQSCDSFHCLRLLLLIYTIILFCIGFVKNLTHFPLPHVFGLRRLQGNPPRSLWLQHIHWMCCLTRRALPPFKFTACARSALHQADNLEKLRFEFLSVLELIAQILCAVSACENKCGCYQSPKSFRFYLGDSHASLGMTTWAIDFAATLFEQWLAAVAARVPSSLQAFAT